MPLDPGSFGARLRAMRRAAGLTQQRLADTAGCTKAYVSQLEQRESGAEVGAFLLTRLAGALGRSFSELFDGTPAPTTALTAEDRAFVRQYLALGEEERARFRKLCALWSEQWKTDRDAAAQCRPPSSFRLRG